MQTLRRIATILIFFLLVFFYFQPNPVILEETQGSIHYRIELSDSFNLFYFQCPQLSWNVEGISSIRANGQVYPTQGNQSFCGKAVSWQIADITVTSQREILTETAWGVLLLILFVWLLVGCFENAERWDRLAVFSFIWGFAFIMHLISYSYMRTTFYIGEVHTIFTILAAVLVLTNPKRILPLALLAFAQIIEYYVRSPYSSNHTFTISLLNLVLLIALGIHLLRNRAINRELFYKSFSPILRVMLLILYFWAGFHKLNSSFVNPAESCAVNFYEATRFNFPFLPTGDWMSYSIIYGTFILEFGLPLLLIFPKTRFFAMLIGIGFHGFLGLSNFRDFSFLVFVFYFSFISEDGLERAKDLIPNFLQYIPIWLKQLLWAMLITVMVIALPGIREEQYAFAVGLLANVVNVLVFGIIVLYWLYRQWIKHEDTLLAPLMRPASVLLWVVAIFYFINGAMPFIGLKTDNSLDMYSNLHTEQGSNHFLFPAYGQIFDYPNDVVEIIESSETDFNPNDARLVFWTFRERFYEQQPDYVIYRRNGTVYRVDASNAAELLGSPAPEFLKKFMVFQEISNQCGV